MRSLIALKYRVADQVSLLVHGRQSDGYKSFPCCLPYHTVSAIEIMHERSNIGPCLSAIHLMKVADEITNVNSETIALFGTARHLQLHGQRGARSSDCGPTLIWSSHLHFNRGYPWIKNS